MTFKFSHKLALQASTQSQQVHVLFFFFFWVLLLSYFFCISIHCFFYLWRTILLSSFFPVFCIFVVDHWRRLIKVESFARTVSLVRLHILCLISIYIYNNIIFFPKEPKSTFYSSEKITIFLITILHFIDSDDFVVNERCHMKKPKTHNSFTLRFLYRFLCVSLFSTICGFRPFWK